MREAIPSGRRTDSACTSGAMGRSTEGIGQRTTFKGSESTNGKMEGSIKENGARTTCMVSGSTSTKTEDGLEASSRRIRRKDMAFTTGKMAACTRATGSKASSMALESTLFLRIWRNSASGRKARELNGTMTRKSKKSTIIRLTIDSTLEMSNSTIKSSKRSTGHKTLRRIS